MSDKIYNGKIKSVETSKIIARKGKRRILLSVIGIGDAFINWNKTPKGVEFPKGADIQVKMFKHEDQRWFVKEIISINGKTIRPPNSNKSTRKQRNNRSREDDRNQKPRKKGILNRLLKGTGGNLRKLYLYAMGGANIDVEKLESRAQSLAPFIEYTELAKNHKNISKKGLDLSGKWFLSKSESRLPKDKALT